MPIGRGNRIHNFHAESIALPQRAKNIDVAGSLFPEAVVVADQQLTQAKPSPKDELDEIFRRV
jgi:hypothetical protein